MLNRRYLLLAALLLLFYTSALGEYTHCKRVDDNVNYRLYWDLSIEGKVKFMVQAETAGWLGLGLSTGGEHPMISNGDRSDIWVGWVDPDSTSSCHSGCVYDYSVAEYQRPSKDPEQYQSLTLLNASFVAGVTTLEYIRNLTTNDTLYDRSINPDSLTTFIWALNPSGRVVPSQDGTTFEKHNADTKGVFSIKLNDPSTCVKQPNSPYSFSNEDGTYSAWWVLDGEDAIKFTITAQTTGWIGIGFATSASMIDADLYVGWIDPSGNAVMTDRYAYAHSMPLEDEALGGKNSVIQVESAEDGDDSITSITFSRPLAALDKYDVAVKQGKMYLLWAYGSSVNYTAKTFNKHKARGVMEVQLLEGTSVIVEPSTRLFKMHGIIMVISFCLLLFPGMLVSRYYKLNIPKWFHIHSVTQTFGVVGVIIGFITILVAKSGTFVFGLHQVLGLVAALAYVAQFAVGFVTYFASKKLQNPEYPTWPHKVHWWLGWVLSGWTIVTIYLGLRMYGVTSSVMMVYTAWFALAAAAVVALQYMIGQTHAQQNNYVTLELKSTNGEDNDLPANPIKANSVDASATSKPKLLLYGFYIFSVILFALGLGLEGSGHTIENNLTPPPNSKDTFEMTFQFGDYVVPNKSTNYVCRGFFLPNETDYHVIGFRPIKDNQEMLHHMILYETTNYLGSDYFDCSSMPSGSTPLFTWAVGGQGKDMPANVGFRIGKNAGKYTALQIHYDNPNEWSERTDSSGVKLIITTNIREVDAGYFVTGVSTKSISIPPGKEYFEIYSECDTTQMFKDKTTIPEYTILSAGLHMHMLGHQSYTEQFRYDKTSNATTSIGTVGCNDFFSFNNQNSEYINATLRPGDKFVHHCMYATTSKATTTSGCEETSCEMCLNFMIYYPKVPNTTTLTCGSRAITSANTQKTMHCN